MRTPMRTIFILTAFVVLPVSSPQGSEVKSIKPNDRNWYFDPQVERVRLPKFKDIVTRKNDELIIKLKSGGDLKSRNEKSEFNRHDFSFIDCIGEMGYALRYDRHEEDSRYILASLQNGSTFYVESPPFLSPDRKRFISLTPSPSFNAYGGIQVWTISPSKLVLEWEYPTDEAVADLTWIDSKSAQLQTHMRSGPPGEDNPTQVRLFRLDKDGWKLASETEGGTGRRN